MVRLHDNIGIRRFHGSDVALHAQKIPANHKGTVAKSAAQNLNVNPKNQISKINQLNQIAPSYPKNFQMLFQNEAVDIVSAYFAA